MKTRLWFAVACAFLVFGQTAWGQVGPGYAAPRAYPPMMGYSGPMAGPYGAPPAGMPMQMGPQGPMPMMGQPCPCPEQCDEMPPLASVYGWDVYGEFLYLRPRNNSVAYGVEFNGPIDTPPGAATPIQVAPPGETRIDFQPAWRVGIAKTLDPCSAIDVSYTHFQGDTEDAIAATDGFLIRSMVSHPSTWISNAVSDWVTANATYDIRFDLGDVDYRWIFLNNKQTTLGLIAGARYASLEQTFNAHFAFNGEENVHTHIHFEGAGPRIGLFGERRGTDWGLFVYGKGTASFAAGTARASYVQTDTFAVEPVVNTGYHADRIMSMLDLELGVGWASPGERIRLSAGYLISGWFNTVRTDEFIQAVQRNDFIGLSNTMTFDGLVATAEVRF
jgi:hypothetical protein